MEVFRFLCLGGIKHLLYKQDTEDFDFFFFFYNFEGDERFCLDLFFSNAFKGVPKLHTEDIF